MWWSKHTVGGMEVIGQSGDVLNGGDPKGGGACPLGGDSHSDGGGTYPLGGEPRCGSGGQ
jgi:hypothetical protein